MGLKFFRKKNTKKNAKKKWEKKSHVELFLTNNIFNTCWFKWITYLICVDEQEWLIVELGALDHCYQY